MKLLKIFAWIFFFPFMLTYWALKKQNKPVMILGGILSLFLVIGVIFSEPDLEENNDILSDDIVYEEVESIGDAKQELSEDSEEKSSEASGEETEDVQENDSKKDLEEEKTESTNDNIKIQKDGFKSGSVSTLNMVNYKLTIPEYWKESVNVQGYFQAHAETGTKLAMLDVADIYDDADVVNFEILKKDKDNLINGYLQNFENPVVISSNILEINDVKGYIYDFSFENNGLEATGSMFAFPIEEANSWGMVSYINTLNADYSYQNDFLKTIDSIALVNGSKDISSQSTFDGYTLIEVDGGDLSGYRESNVVVDIGFGDREYWAFTNEYGQLIKVIANEITLQNEATEKVTSKGRYYWDEAKVPGTESSSLDEGHVIADSLGGVANAYNITPQNSTLNRHGDQAYMEKVIRDAINSGLKVTMFSAVISYPDNNTQIPNRYKYTYTIDGNVIVDEFDNINPDEANTGSTYNPPTTPSNNSDNNSDINLEIIHVDKRAEEVTIKNNSNSSINLNGFRLVSVKGNQSYTFNSYILEPNETVIVYGKGGSGDLQGWTAYVWSNSDPDPAELYDNNGILIDRWDD